MKTKKYFKLTLLIGTISLLLQCALAVYVQSEQQQQQQHMAADNDIDDLAESANRSAPTWSVVYDVAGALNITMTQQQTVHVRIEHIDAASWGDEFEFHFLTPHTELLHIERIVHAKAIESGATSWSGNVTVEALFMGRAQIYVELQRPHELPEKSQEILNVIILRNVSNIDVLFQVCVGCFVMVLYVNFGAALDLQDLKRIVLRPVGPAIGMVGQFIIMPVLSFFIGYIFFRDMIELRLGLFFTGSTPGGGSSNIFTVLLNGNLSLSITMTALSNLMAFIMMPFWIFTLGALIFHDGNFVIPYRTIITMSFSLVLPLCIGISLQKYTPDFAKKIAKLLKPIALVMIIAITVFAFTVNSYMFKLFSMKILIASSALPWIGYIIGWSMAILLKQSPRDALTIAIETGIQNTGIAIFMLCFTLPQPQADMTSAVPVANSMMTPLPLLLIYFIRKCFRRTSIEEVEEAPTKEAKVNEVEAIMEKGQVITSNTK